MELLNDNDSIVEKRRLFIEGTSGVCDISLSNVLKQGSYKLHAYTNYMLNDNHISFFEKSVMVARRVHQCEKVIRLRPRLVRVS